MPSSDFAILIKLGLWRPLLRSFVKSLYLLYVPYLLGFILKSHEILQCSAIEVRKHGYYPVDAPAKPSSTQKHNSKSIESWTYKIFLDLRVLVSLEIGVLQWILPMENLILNRQLKQALLNITESCMVTSLVFAVLSSAFRMCDTFSNLSQSQAGTEQGGNLFTNLNLCIIFFFVSVTVGSFQNDTACVCVVAFALVCFATEGNMGKLRQWWHMFGFWAHHSLAVLFIVYNIRHTFTQSPEGDTWFAITFQDLNMSYLPTAMSSYYSGALIARMLRYDFQNHVDELKLCTDKAGEPREVIIMPSTPFPKPYFTAAIVAWSFVRVATVVLCLVAGFPFKNLYDACFVAVVIEFPAITAAVFLLGVIRGEAKSLWKYEERWIREPSNLDKEMTTKKQ